MVTEEKKTVRKSTDGFSVAKKPRKVPKAEAKNQKTEAKTPGVKKPTVAGSKPASGVKKPTATGLKPAPAKKAPVAAQETPEKPVMASRGRFIDFAPNRAKRPLNASESEMARKKAEFRPEPRPVVPRPPRSKVPVKRPVRVTTTFAAHSNMPQMETPTGVVERTTVITTADGAMPDLSPAQERPVRRRRFPTRVTHSGAVTMPSVPGVNRGADRGGNRGTKEVDARIDTMLDSYLDDDAPLMSDDDLKTVLAGFADDTDEYGSNLTDDLSPEAADFAEEIDALDSSLTVGDAIAALEEEEAEDFVKEPKALFDDTEDGDEPGEATTEAPVKRERYQALYTSVDGKSPFLTSVSVEKRPLSGGSATTVEAVSVGAAEKRPSSERPARAPEAPARHKNVYEKRSSKPEARAHETVVVTTPVTDSKSVGLVIAIVLTVLLGAGVGALVYLIFF